MFDAFLVKDIDNHDKHSNLIMLNVFLFRLTDNHD